MSRILLIVSIVTIFILIATTLMPIRVSKGVTLAKSNVHENVYPLLRSVRGDTAKSKEKELVIFDFPKTSNLNQWRSINDTVMGGISGSQLQLTKEGNALFTGNVSLENNGGFASVQSVSSFYNLQGFDGIAIRVKGDGKRYKLSLKNSAYMGSPRYQAVFNTEKGAWTTIRLPFRSLIPTMHGRILENEPPIDISKILSFVLLISDKQEGSFLLEIDWIKAYRIE